MKKIAIRSLKYFGLLLAAVIVMVAIILSVIRAVFPHLDANDYRPSFEKWAGQTLHHPVRVNTIKASWSGFEPTLDFQYVTVLDKNDRRPLIQAQSIRVSIDLLASLLEWHLRTNNLEISGVHLKMKQLDADKISVNGITVTNPLNHKQKDIAEDKNEFLDWLLSQQKIILNKVNVSWEGKQGKIIFLKNFRLQIVKKYFHHQLSAQGAIQLPSVQHNPTTFRLVLNFDNHILTTKIFKGNGYAEINNLVLQNWLTKYQRYGLHIGKGDANLQLWGSWDNNKIEELQSQFDVNNLVVKRMHDKNRFDKFNKLSGSVVWTRISNGWSLVGKNISMTIKHRTWPPTQFKLRILRPKGSALPTQILHLSYLHIQDLQRLLLMSTLLPNQYEEIVKGINLKGNISNLTLKHNGAKLTPMELTLATSFNNLSANAWNNLPGFTHLSGQFFWSSKQARLDLDAQHTTLNFKKLFKQKVAFAVLKARVFLQLKNKALHIKASNMVVQIPTASIRGQMSLVLPRSGENGKINLLAAFNCTDLSKLRSYFPRALLHHKSLTHWLMHMNTSGKGITGAMLLRGPLKGFPYDDKQGKFVVAARLNDIEFEFLPQWPVINHMNAIMHVDGRTMKGKINSGEVYNSRIQTANVVIANLGFPRLKVNAKIHGPLEDGIRYIKNSPLKKHLSGLEKLRFSGPMQMNLHLNLPLEHMLPKAKRERELRAYGDIAINKGDLRIPEWRIHAEKVVGKIAFTKDSVAGKNIHAVLFGQPILANVVTLQRGDKSQIFQISVGGKIKAAALRNYLGYSLLDYFRGATDYRALLQIHHVVAHHKTDYFNTLSFATDLRGVSVNLPEPFYKSKDAAIPSHVNMKFNAKERLRVSIHYGKKLSSDLTYVRDKKRIELAGGEIHFGVGKVAFRQPGLLIDGKLNYFAWSEWKPYVEAIQKKRKREHAEKAKKMLHGINLEIGQISIFGQKFNRAKLQVQPVQDGWIFTVNSPEVEGHFFYPDGYPNKAVTGNFKRLYLKTNKKQRTKLIPNDFPPLDIKSSDVRVGKHHLGRVHLRITPQTKGIDIVYLHVTAPHFILLSHGKWLSKLLQQKTEFEGRLTSRNLGAFLRNWKITKNMVGGEGVIRYKLNWKGAPYEFKLDGLNGHVNLDFNQGKIIHLSKSAEAKIGLGRVISLFSLQAIPQRLMTGFKDITGDGFNYRVLRGKFVLKNGDATSRDAYFDGPVAKIEIKGTIGLATKTYNAHLYVIPHLTSSLPVIATIAGGPIAGAITWLVDKIIRPGVRKISMNVYRITGSWEHPKIKEIEVPAQRHRIRKQKPESRVGIPLG